VSHDAHVGQVARLVDVHFRRRAARRLLAVVEGEPRVVGHPGDHEAAAADVTGRGVHDREGELGGDRRVHRVAAVPQDLEPGGRRERIGGDHHAAVGQCRGPVRIEAPGVGKRHLARLRGVARLGGRPGAGRGKQRQGQPGDGGQARE